MTSEQQAKLERIKAERAKCTTPLARLAFDNDPRNGPIGLRIVAMTETS